MSLFQELYAEGAFSRGWWRLSGGAIACFLAYYVLLSNIEKDPLSVAVVVVVIEIALAVAFATGKGRRFATGFIAIIISMAIFSKGLMLVIPWGYPVALAYGAAKPLWGAANDLGADSRRRDAWVINQRGQPSSPAQGQILVNLVNECAAKARERDTLSSYPRAAAKLQETSNCPDLSLGRADSAASPERFTAKDFGWRWRYTAGAPDSLGRIPGYAVRVFEDSSLSRASPQYVSDEMGWIRQLEAGKPPAVVASPVKSLAMLSACVARIPGERAKEAKLDKAERYKLSWRSWSEPIDEVLGRCSELRGHVGKDYPNHSDGAIALTARGAASGKLADTVGIYTVALIPIDPRLFVFELSATPRNLNGSHAGIRNYFVARDGSIHVRVGARARESDPAVSE